MKQELEEAKAKVAQNPKDSSALKMLGSIYLNNYYFKKAQEEYSLAVNFNPRLSAEIILDHERLIEQEPKNIEARMSLISFLLNSGEIDAAMLELEELIEIDSANAKIYNLLGRIYISLGKIDSAVILLEKALARGIKDIGISQMLAGAYLEKNRLEDAIRFYEELLSLTPNDINILRTLGELYTRTKKFDPAAKRYGRLFAADPESAGEVIKKLEKLLLEDETNLTIRETLAEIYMKSLKPDLAAEILEQILLLDKGKIDFAAESTKQLLKNYPGHPKALLLLAAIQVEKGNFSEAIENFKDLTRHHPDFTEQAILGCRQILKKYPDQYLAHQFLAETHLAAENTKDAGEELMQILALHKESADWILLKCRNLVKKHPLLHEIIGYAYLKKGNLDRAAQEAEALLPYDKNYAAGHILLGRINLEKNLTRKAQDSFQKALLLSPYDIEIHQICQSAKLKELKLEEESLKTRGAHLDLAKVYVKMDQRSEAIRELQLSSHAQQDASAAYNLMAELYIEEGRFNLAQSIIKKALEEIKDQSQSIIYQLRFKFSLCLEAQGNIKKAIKILEEILSEDIEYPGLCEKIKFLKNSSLKSLQKKMLTLLIFNPENKNTYAMWGRESKSSGGRQSISQSFGQSHNNAGFDYYIKGMFAAAQEEFDLASKIDPALAAAVNNLGITYVTQNRLTEAVQKFREAQRIEPASSILLNNLGVAYFLEGSLTESEKYLKLAKENNPNLAAAAINLADAAYSRGQAQIAIESYQSVEKGDILYSLAQKRLVCKTA